MTEPRKLRSGFVRPWYQPPPRRTPSAPVAPATLVVESDDDEDDVDCDDDEMTEDIDEVDEEGGGKEGGGEREGGEDEDDDDTDTGSSSCPPSFSRRESRKDDSNEGPIAEKCGHTIHPAYAEFYPHLLCPLCRLEKTIEEALHPARILLGKSGKVAWIEEIHATTEKDSDEREQAKKYLHSIVPLSRSKAGKPKSFDLHVDEDDNISFPRARTGAWNRVRELELFRDAENAWNELFPFEKLEGPLRVRVIEAWGHDATIALTRWDKEHLEAISGSVTKQDENTSRKRAREDELALRDDFPGPQKRRSLTQEQIEWAEARNAAEGWTLESGGGSAPDEDRPRKRRCIRTLHFNNILHVREIYEFDSSPNEQIQREMADEERRRREQLQQPAEEPQEPEIAPRGGMATAVAWAEHAKDIAQEYLRRLAENAGL
ncbi:hypothetical protein G6514_008136 [Epicoccum nigrum]|nr:hypothetical protein G6514_008136 [Epicoccum nigrum]